jgi:hypothetical protein
MYPLFLSVDMEVVFKKKTERQKIQKYYVADSWSWIPRDAKDDGFLDGYQAFRQPMLSTGTQP